MNLISCLTISFTTLANKFVAQNEFWVILVISYISFVSFIFFSGLIFANLVEIETTGSFSSEAMKVGVWFSCLFGHRHFFFFFGS